MTKPTVTPAPGDVMSEDVLKSISFLRNDAHDCVWIADLIERLTRALPSGAALRSKLHTIIQRHHPYLPDGNNDHVAISKIACDVAEFIEAPTRGAPQPEAPTDKVALMVKWVLFSAHRWHRSRPLRQHPLIDLTEAADLIERLARERNCYRNDAMRDRARLRKAEAILAQVLEADVQRVKDISRLVIERDEAREVFDALKDCVNRCDLDGASNVIRNHAATAVARGDKPCPLCRPSGQVRESCPLCEGFGWITKDGNPTEVW